MDGPRQAYQKLLIDDGFSLGNNQNNIIDGLQLMVGQLTA